MGTIDIDIIYIGSTVVIIFESTSIEWNAKA